MKLDVPGGWIVSGTGVLQNPQEVLTAKARERLTHVLESDEVITIVGDDEVGPGRVDRAGRSPGLALHRRHGQRLRLGHGEELRLARDARDDPGQGPDPDQHGLPPGSRQPLCQRRPGGPPRARVLLEAVGAVRRSRS